MASANDNALASRVALQKRFFNAAVIVKGETIVFAGSQSFSYVHHLRNKRPVYSQRRTTALNNSTRYCRETVSSLIRLMLYRLKKDWYLAVSDCPWLRVFFAEQERTVFVDLSRPVLSAPRSPIQRGSIVTRSSVLRAPSSLSIEST